MTEKIDLQFICRNCLTDIREGEHYEAEISERNGDCFITRTCRVPRDSKLPRMIVIFTPGEYIDKIYDKVRGK